MTYRFGEDCSHEQVVIMLMYLRVRNRVDAVFSRLSVVFMTRLGSATSEGLAKD
jgi:hypothetical protein